MNHIAWQWTPYLIPLIVGGTFTLVFALITWRRQETRARRTTALLLGSISIWSLGFALEIMSGEPEMMKFWDTFQFFGNAFLPVLWLAYALLYTGRWEKPSIPAVGLLLILPLLLLVLVFTNDSHGLIWNSVTYELQGSIMVRVKTNGMALWGFYVYAYTLILIGNFLLIQTLFRSRRLFRWQGFALIFGAVIPWAVSILHLTGFISSNFDHTPLILTFTGLTVFINIDRLWRGDVIPVAHRTIFESIEDAICVLDRQNRIVDLNPAAEMLTGLTLTETIGKIITEAWPEWETLIHSRQDLGASGNELLLQTAAGARYYDVRFSPLVTWQDKLISKVVVLRDITHRRKAQAELETYANALEERNLGLLALQSASQVIASSLELDKVLQSVNKQLTLLLDVPGSAVSEWDQCENTITTLARIVPTTWLIIPDTSFHLDDYPATKRVLKDGIISQMTISQEDIDPAEQTFMRKAGLKTLLMLPLMYQNQVFGLVEIMDDREERIFNPSELSLAQLLANQAASAIENARLHAETERRLAEQTALKEITATLASTLDIQTVLNRIVEQLTKTLGNTSSYICLFDQETTLHTVIAEYISAAASELERVSDVGKSYPETDTEFIEGLKAGDVDLIHIEDPDLRTDDRLHMEQFGAYTMLCVPLNQKGKLIGWAEIWESRHRREFTDDEIALSKGIAQQAAFALENAELYQKTQQELEERKRLQAHLERYTRELTRSNEELQYFAYVASHDLREPLRMITSYLQLLARRYQGQLDTDADEFIQFAVDGAKRMEELIHGLLLYSRVETRSAELAAVSCGEVVTDVLTNLKVAIEESGARVIYEDLPTLLADPNQLNLLFQNLLANAIKYRRDVPPEIHITAKEQNNVWTFCIADNGIGFDPEQSGRIFMIFQRLHTQEDFTGLGLGLAISKKIVERHRGRIWAESEPGQGSRFYFTIPNEANLVELETIIPHEKVISPAQA